LFSFALGLFLPPAFHNISWKTFIIFGVLRKTVADEQRKGSVESAMHKGVVVDCERRVYGEE